MRVSKLSPNQEIAIELLLEKPTITNKDLAEALGMHYNTIALWRTGKDNGLFKKEYQKRLKEKWEQSEGIAIDTIQKLAENGDFKASKYILDSLGYAPVQKQEIKAEVDNNIVINIDEGE